MSMNDSLNLDFMHTYGHDVTYSIRKLDIKMLSAFKKIKILNVVR